MLVSMDDIGLFTNTPQDKSAQSVGETLSEESHGETPPPFLVRPLEIIQEYNIFEFNGQLWPQEIGSAMGQHHVE